MKPGTGAAVFSQAAMPASSALEGETMRSAGRSGGGAELPETCDGGETETAEVTLTRSELDALVDEAVRKDRARR